MSELVPKDKTIDNSLALLKEGYLFIQNRCRRYNSDIFETRLMGQKVICISGEEAASVFYDPDKFQRKGAAPKRVQKTLFGVNAIQTMDGEEHHHRKALFMGLMTPERIEELGNLTRTQWKAASKRWGKEDKIVLFEEAQDLLCKVACEWAGVPLKEEEIRERAQDFTDMVDAFGAVGPRFWRGKMARSREEKWVEGIIEDIRKGELMPREGSAAHAMAWHKNLDGKHMESRMAAVELINIIRPIVAIATYIAYGALALQYPESRKKLHTGDQEYLKMFVQEVRRYYPFGPFLGARVREDFSWRGEHFEKGTLVLLDVYGTNHDPRLWENPGKFNPERFHGWKGGMFDLIPQGGGDYHTGHRCAGEQVTIEIMKVSIEHLAKDLQYEIREDEQDISFSMVRMPSRPESGVVLRNIRFLQ
ncbi:MAG TPA: cytochrome P450 [Bacillaceae bacterium]